MCNAQPVAGLPTAPAASAVVISHAWLINTTIIDESLSHIDRGARCHRASCSGRGKEFVLLSGCSDLNLLPVQSANACAPASYFGLINFDAVVLVTSFHRRSPHRRQPAEHLDYTAIC